MIYYLLLRCGQQAQIARLQRRSRLELPDPVGTGMELSIFDRETARHPTMRMGTIRVGLTFVFSM